MQKIEFVSLFMKTLYVVRHAKSSWEDPLLDDFSRPLNNRGEKDAPRMGKRLKEKNIFFDLIMTSSARRTLATAKILSHVLEYDENKIKSDVALYLASPTTMLSAIRNLNDSYNTVMIVGHNPGLIKFVNQLMNQQFDNIPTCGIAACTLNVKSWQNTIMGMGKMILYDYPKSSTGSN